MANEKKNNEVPAPEVTCKITWLNDDPKASKKASANITIAKSFTIHGLSVMNSNKGLFVAMPTKIKQDQGGNKYYEVAHPVTANMRTAITEKVLAAYQMAIESQEQGLKEDSEKSEEESSETESETEQEEETQVEEPEEDEGEDENFVQSMGQTM